MGIEALTIIVTRSQTEDPQEARQLATARAEQAGFLGDPDAVEETDYPEAGWAIRWEREW